MNNVAGIPISNFFYLDFLYFISEPLPWYDLFGTVDNYTNRK